MRWGMGLMLGVIWLSLLIVLGVRTLRNGHTALFWIGIIVPVLWIVGALMAPTEGAIARGA